MGLCLAGHGGRLGPSDPATAVSAEARCGSKDSALGIIPGLTCAATSDTRWERYKAARQPAVVPSDPDREFREITARLTDVEEATGDAANRGRQLMRQFMARSGERGVTVSMIVERLKAEHIPVGDRSVRRWLAEDTDAGITERATHLLWRMRNPDAA